MKKGTYLRNKLRMLLLASLTLASTPSWAKVYVHASAGSFNDTAITQLFLNEPSLKDELVFAGSPTNAFQLAAQQNALAFSAVENSTIEGRLVKATVEALEQYKIRKVIAVITIPIEMCVLMNKDELESNQTITQLASHPAALKQINKWKKNKAIIELEVPKGTAAAAKMVSKKQLLTGTAAIGSCSLASTFTNLSVVEKGIQDNKDNKTTFLLMQIEKRTAKISTAKAKEELKLAITSK